MLFLSHASEDAAAVKELAQRMREAGLEVWLDLDELGPGDNWMESLESALGQSDAFAVYVGQVGVERWINREVRVALDRNVRDPDFRVIPILGRGANPEKLPTFLAQHQWLDLRAVDLANEDASHEGIQQLFGRILERPAQVVPVLPPGEAPFRGLLAFDVDHAHLFFGRDRETEELLEKLRVAPFLAVIGDSGSGKSSLVRAGLVPALHRGRFDAGGEQSWQTLVVRPGRDPFRELSNALADLAPGDDPVLRMTSRADCADRLASGCDGLRASVEALTPAGRRTLLIVDQFEELFTQTADPTERNRFIDTLLAAGDATGEQPLHVLITLRADFYSACFDHPKLPEMISANQYPARAIDREQLVEVIEKPAAMAGLSLEPGLVDAILHDVGEESASLALLEHTLLELWKLRSGDTLTHQSYESIGRVQGALEHHAEDVFGALPPEQQRQAQKLMLRLAVPGKGDHVSRCQVARDQLIPHGDAGEAAEEVLRHLVEQRLLTFHQAESDTSKAEEVEVAHEALLRGWGRFRSWLEADREFLLWRQRNQTALEAWEESERDPGALLRGGPLAEAKRWLDERSEDLSEAGLAFIQASFARARRAQRIKRALMATIAALALIAVVFAFFALSQQRQADREAATAESALGFLVGLFEVSDPGEARGNTITAREILDQGAAKIQSELAGEPVTQARLLHTMGRVYLNLGLYQEAAPLLEQALEIRVSLLGEDHLDVAATLLDLSGLYLDQGRYDEAQLRAQRSLAIREQVLGPGHPAVAASLQTLSSIHTRKGDYAEAEKLVQRALAIDEKALGAEHPSVATRRYSLAVLQAWQGDYAAAIPLASEALASQERALGEDHPDVAASVNLLAIAHYNLGEYDLAEPLLERTLALQEKLLGADHPAVAGALNNLSELYTTQANYEQSEQVLRRALDIQERVLGPDHDDTAMSLHNLGELYRIQGRNEDAEPLLRRALKIREERLGPDHRFVASTLHQLGALRAGESRFDEAEPLLERALEIRENVLGVDNPDTRDTAGIHASVVRALGRSK